MDAGETFRIATRSIRANRLRSALTVIGVVIGIASVIVFATFGASVKADVVTEIGTTSANNIYLLPEDDEEGGPGGFAEAAAPAFTTDDIERIRGIEGVRAVIPRGLVPIAGVTYRNQTVARRQATATTPATFQEESIVDGRAFEMGADQVVLNEVAAAAFEENVTVGERLIVRLASGEERNLTVVGIVSGTRGGFLGGFGDATPRFYLPVDPFYTSTVGVPGAGYDQKAYPQVTVVSDTRRVQSVKEAIVAYASEESDARELLPEGVGVTVRTSEDIVEEIQDVIERITRFVTGIAVLSLVVGAIGIANITLVSVAERTREIGIMKAVGARNRDVLQLFLTEAVLLGVLGAGVGVPLGLLVGWGATAYAEVSFAIALDWLVGAVVMGVSVGVVAGLYPAWRASKVDPIDALRYE